MQGAAWDRWWVERPLMVVLVFSQQICIFVGETLLFSNWAITADILMVRQAMADRSGQLGRAGEGVGELAGLVKGDSGDFWGSALGQSLESEG